MHACTSICCKTQWHSFAQKVFSKVPCTQYCAKYLWGDMRGTRLDTPSRSFQSSTWIREQSGRNLWVPQTPEEEGGGRKRGPQCNAGCWLEVLSYVGFSRSSLIIQQLDPLRVRQREWESQGEKGRESMIKKEITVFLYPNLGSDIPLPLWHRFFRSESLGWAHTSWNKY